MLIEDVSIKEFSLESILDSLTNFDFSIWGRTNFPSIRDSIYSKFTSYYAKSLSKNPYRYDYPEFYLEDDCSQFNLCYIFDLLSGESYYFISFRIKNPVRREFDFHNKEPESVDMFYFNFSRGDYPNFDNFYDKLKLYHINKEFKRYMVFGVEPYKEEELTFDFFNANFID